MTQAPSKPHDIQALDALTGGAFSAPTAGERAQRVRDWLASEPAPEQMQEVFKELASRDKGAARPLREKLDEIKRAKNQDAIGAEWAHKAQALLALPRLNIADAMAWQRDAAKAGAPLSREPLAGFKAQLAARVKAVEDLQHRAQVHREAALLLAQRFDVLSTKPWQEASAVAAALSGDVGHWQQEADALAANADWSSLEARFAPQLDASRTQLAALSEAFHSALAQATAAAADAAAPLPPVPVWADQLRVARGQGAPEGATADKPARAAPAVDPAQRAAAQQAVTDALEKLERETAQGHGKASAGAATVLRAVLKTHGRLVEPPLEARVHAALVAAGELQGWQRWSADKVREDLVARAEGLLKRPEGQALGGRKIQEQLRALREQWKQADQGGAPNHALWKRFDEACNEAHKTVEAWLEKVRADAAEHRTRRLALIEEVRAWAAEHAVPSDLKAHLRALHQFADRWRDGGHMGEKALAELRPQWNEAFGAARAPLEAAQKSSVERRQAMIEEAGVLGAAPQLRIDAVKALQQRWQAEAQAVPLERRLEQKLWDAFRQPLDEAFNRKGAEREQAAAAMGAFDRAVLEASRALDAANASGDAQRIRAAMQALEAALRGEAPAQPAASAPTASADGPDRGATGVVAPGQAAAEFSESAHRALAPDAETGDAPASAGSSAGGVDDLVAPADGADATARTDAAAAEAGEAASVEGPASGATPAAPTQAPADVAAVAPPKTAPRPVIAVRGDDRPGQRRTEVAPIGRGGRFGADRRDGRDARGPSGPGARRGGSDERGPARFGERESRGPRLGDAAFRAQRDAIEHAQQQLRKLAAQAHGEALTQLLDAWQARDAERVPGVQDLGRAVSPSVRGQWQKALQQAPTAEGEASEALLRLEMAAELPTPAEHMDARRALQLQLLTRRNDPAPVQTWGQDAAQVLAAAHEAGAARRLQAALKVLLRR